VRAVGMGHSDPLLSVVRLGVLSGALIFLPKFAAK
jgi:hypothetical protein